MRFKSETSDLSYWSPHLAGVSPIFENTERRKIRNDRSGKMRDDQLSRKAELSQLSDGILKILQTCM